MIKRTGTLRKKGHPENEILPTFGERGKERRKSIRGKT